MKQLVVKMSVLCLLFSTICPSFAQDNNAEKFLAARQALSEVKDIRAQKVIGIGAAVVAPVGAVVVYKMFEDNISWYRTVGKYNAFTEQIRKIGLPKDLVDYFGSLPKEVRYSGEALKNVPAGYTEEMLKACQNNLIAIENAKNWFHRARRLSGDGGRKVQRQMERALRDYSWLEKDRTLRGVNKMLTEEYIPYTLDGLKKFRKTYPDLKYTHQYGWHIPMPYSRLQKNWMMAQIAGWEADVNGVIQHGKYKGMFMETREMDGGVACFVRLTRHNKAQRFSLAKTVGTKTTKALLPIAILGIALYDAPTAGAQDMAVAQRLRENAQLAFDMSDEEAEFILQHAKDFTQTIDVYAQYAQWADGFNQLNEEEKTNLIQEVEALQAEEDATQAQEQAELSAEQLRRGLRSALRTVRAY